MLNQKQIDEFKDLYLKKYGVKLDDQKASQMAQALFDYVRLMFDTQVKNMPL